MYSPAAKCTFDAHPAMSRTALGPSPAKNGWPPRSSSMVSISLLAAGASRQPDVAVAALPQVVLLESDLHRVHLRPGDHHGRLARREHVVGKDHHAVVAGVHHADRRHLAELLVAAQRLTPDRGSDVAGGDLGHRLDREPGLRDADRYGRLPGHGHLRGDADGVDLRVRLGLV